MTKNLFFIVFVTLSLFFVACTQKGTKTNQEVDNRQLNALSTITASDTLKIGNALRNDILANELSFLKPEDRRYSLDKFDLNGDGKEEYFVGFANEYLCRNDGCTYFILNNDGTLNSRITISYAPFTVLSSETNGWSDLLVVSASEVRKLTFDGSSYPSHPWELPIVNQDSVLKKDDLLNIVLEGKTEYSF